MNFEEFRRSLAAEKPANDVSAGLQALWHDAKGNWDDAHETVQDLSDESAAWIHAYLHRKEGDIGNADYWYRRAGKKRPATTLAEEWETIVKALLKA